MVAVLTGVITGSVSLTVLTGLTARSTHGGDPAGQQAASSRVSHSIGVEESVGPRPPSDEDAVGPAPAKIADDERVLAIDADAMPLPVAVGDQVELVGLEPSLTAMTAEVIADDARVVGLTGELVLLVVRADEALRAAEFQAVGSLAMLGRSLPTDPNDG